MIITGKKEKDIISKMCLHSELVLETLNNFKDCFLKYFENDMEGARQFESRTHASESEADDVRKELELVLFKGALMPSSRGDLLKVLEAVDGVANRGESCVDELLLQHIEIPEEIKEDLKVLIDECLKTCLSLRDAVKYLFNDIERTVLECRRTEERESKVDSVERNLVRKVYSLDISLANKLQLRELIKAIADISDIAENASDVVEISAIKRKV